MVDLVSFDIIAKKLGSGEFTKFNPIPSNRLPNGDILIVFDDRYGKQWSTYAQYNPQINEILPPLAPLPVEKWQPPTFAPVIPNIFEETKDRWRVYKETQNKELSFDLAEKGRILWSLGRTFNDLQTLTLMFIQGLLFMTPYHLGPLDPESSIIYDQLYKLNTLGLITTNSEPFDEFVFEGIRKRQRPFIDFVIQTNRLEPFIQRLLAMNKTVYAETKAYLSPSKQYNLHNFQGKDMSQRFENGRWIEDSNPGMQMSQEVNPILNDVNMEELGSNFRSLFPQLTLVHLFDDRFDNSMFTQLIEIAKTI